MDITVRTSDTHPLYIDGVATPGGGLLGLTICPGKKGPSLFGFEWQRDLDTDMAAIALWQPTTALCLMETQELLECGVHDLGAAYGREGITYVHAAIVDQEPPTEEWGHRWHVKVRLIVHGALDRGEKVLVHCKGGLGRAGTVAVRILMERGMSMEAALSRVRTARPGAVETSEQERYLAALATRHPG